MSADTRTFLDVRISFTSQANSLECVTPWVKLNVTNQIVQIIFEGVQEFHFVWSLVSLEAISDLTGSCLFVFEEYGFSPHSADHALHLFHHFLHVCIFGSDWNVFQRVVKVPFLHVGRHAVQLVDKRDQQVSTRSRSG